MSQSLFAPFVLEKASCLPVHVFIADYCKPSFFYLLQSVHYWLSCYTVKILVVSTAKWLPWLHDLLGSRG